MVSYNSLQPKKYWGQEVTWENSHVWWVHSCLIPEQDKYFLTLYFLTWYSVPMVMWNHSIMWYYVVSNTMSQESRSQVWILALVRMLIMVWILSWAKIKNLDCSTVKIQLWRWKGTWKYGMDSMWTELKERKLRK